MNFADALITTPARMAILVGGARNRRYPMPLRGLTALGPTRVPASELFGPVLSFSATYVVLQQTPMYMLE